MWDPQSGNFSPCRTQHKKQAVGSSQLCVVTEWDITLDLAGTQDTFWRRRTLYWALQQGGTDHTKGVF